MKNKNHWFDALLHHIALPFRPFQWFWQYEAPAAPTVKVPASLLLIPPSNIQRHILDPAIVLKGLSYNLKP